MTTISDGAFSQGDIMRRLADLERMVANLSTARRLESASIGQGGVSITNGAVKIYDADGFVRAQIGKLPDGSYDIAAFDQLGTSVNMAALAFGLSTATIATSESTPSTTYTDLFTLGPSVDVEIGSSGRALVTLSAGIIAGASDGGYMAVEVSGASVVPAADANGLETFGSGGAGVTTRSAVVFAITDLTPGLNTFTCKYRALATSGFFRNRTIVVQPF